jgi:hypothetical protein
LLATTVTTVPFDFRRDSAVKLIDKPQKKPYNSAEVYTPV